MMCNKMYVEREGTTEISEEFIINNEFVNLLNENEEIFKIDINNKNKGYPILKWE